MLRTMPSTVARDRSAFVVISPETMARSVVTIVSHATRLVGSARRQWSRMASLIWSATLSGWPMETDSLDQQVRSVLTIKRPLNEGRFLAGARQPRLRSSIPDHGMMEHLREIITNQRARQSQP